MDISKWTDDEILQWIKDIKEEFEKMDELKDASEEELKKVILNTMFEGFKQGDLRRTDLARSARLLGFELDDEFMNDPNPDPYELKHKKGRRL